MKMKRRSLLTACMFTLGLGIDAQVSIQVKEQKTTTEVSPNLYGIFYEDINHAADGGLYAELIRNRSFEDDNEISAWKLKSNKNQGTSIKLVNRNLLNEAQQNALQWNISATRKSTVSLINNGFWGINAVSGNTYKLTFWAKGNYKGNLKVRLSDTKTNKVYAETRIKEKIGKGWKKYNATLTSNGNDAMSQFEFVADGKGEIILDMVSLFPPTYKNRENGCRIDLAKMLEDLHPKFMRFPGGCFVEGKKSPENAFHWERTVGPIENRPGHMNVNWNYRTSDGLGFHEYLQLAEDLKAKPLYVVNIGIWHGGYTPVDSLQPWINECLNALEYANGPVSSKYGALRAKNGHPKPFNIEYLEIGNENNQLDPAAQSREYYERFKIFRDAVLAKYPEMHIIGNVVAWADDNPMWRSKEPVELLDEHYYRDGKWFADNFHKYDAYQRGKANIYVGEYAVTRNYGKNGSLYAALGEAVFMMGMENNSDIVKMASYAPIFANVNDIRWAPDMIQFNSEKAFGTPSYYMQKMMADNIGTRIMDVSQENTISKIFSSATFDNRSNEIILKVVNMGKENASTVIYLNGKHITSGVWHQLTAPSGDEENDIINTKNVYPTEKVINAFKEKISVEIPPYSLNVLRFKKESN